MIPFIVSVDTEEDNWRPVHQGASVENIRELPRLAAFFARLGVRPTYFVTHQVASRPWAAGILRDISEGGQAEIAAHVHPWNTPPFADASAKRSTMLLRYPLEVQAAKIRTITATIGEVFGSRPTSFRAGRFGLGQETIAALVREGYLADSSVTPLFSWTAYDDGPDFTEAPVRIYRLDGEGDVRVPVPEGPITEVPLSSGLTRFELRDWHRFARVAQRPLGHALHVAGVAARAGLVRRTILSPEVASVNDMVRLSRGLLAGGVGHIQLFFHSSSLRPGLSPFVTSRSDLERFYGRIERYVERLATLAPIRFSTIGETAAAALPAPAPSRDAPGVAAPIRAYVTPRRLLIVSGRAAADGASGRWSTMAKYLVRRGWEVHLLVPGGGPDDVWEGVATHGCEPSAPATGRKIREFVRRFRPDVVVTHGPPHVIHLAGVLGTFGTGVPHVLDLQEPWWTPSGSPVTSQVRWMVEDWIFRRAERALADNGNLVEALAELHPGARTALLRTGVDTELVPERRPAAGAALSILAVCAGDESSLAPVFRALRFFFDRVPAAAGGAALRIAGDMDARRTEDLAGRFLPSAVLVEVLGARPPAALRDLMAGAQLCVVVPDHDDDVRVSGGLVQSLGAGVPLLVCGNLESATGRQARRIGVPAREPEDVEGLTRVLEEVWRGTPPMPRSLEAFDAACSAATAEALLTGGAPGDDSAGAPDASELPSVANREGRPRANWMWFADPPSWERALEWTIGPENIAPALRLRFARVDVCDASAGSEDRKAGKRRTPRSRWRPLPFGEASFDLVAIQECWEQLLGLAGGPGGRSVQTVLDECRRVLRPGGALLVCAANPFYRRVFTIPGRVLAPHAALTARSMRHALARAGFTHGEVYYATPSHRMPHAIFPATRAALLAHERFTSEQSAGGLLRRALAAAGMHHTLHPSIAFLAYR